jgi:hypothetical protein
MQLRYQCYVYPCFFTLTLSLYHRPFYSTLLTDFSHMLTYSHTSSVVFVFIPSLPFCPSLFPISLFLSIPVSHFHLPSYSTLPATLHSLTFHTHILTSSPVFVFLRRPRPRSGIGPRPRSGISLLRVFSIPATAAHHRQC